MIQDKQITINWHVYYLKVSHDDKDIIDAFIECTKEIYEYETKLKPSRGKIHEYLAMTMDYATPGKATKLCHEDGPSWLLPLVTYVVINDKFIKRKEWDCPHRRSICTSSLLHM